eukprot:PhF_6_TR41005/c0_g1_i4/m.62113
MVRTFAALMLMVCAVIIPVSKAQTTSFGTNVEVFPLKIQNYASHLVDGMYADIEDGYQVNFDFLRSIYSNPKGWAYAWRADWGRLTITGWGQINEYTAALAAIGFKTTSEVWANRRIFW